MSSIVSRRQFTRLSVTALAGVFVLTLATGAVGAESLKFELYADKRGAFRWRLKAANGETLATAGQGYASKGAAKAGIARIKRDAKELKFEMYEDAQKEFRWRVKAKNGQVIGASSEGYKTELDANKAIALIKESVGDAAVSDQTSP